MTTSPEPVANPIEPTSIRQEIVIDVPPRRAFAVFTEQFDRIKPREHNLLAVPIAETVLEPRVGGGVIDHGVDGSQCRWGEVVAYDPPNALTIGWRISPRWEVETDPSRMSEVELRFVEIGPDRTRVELEHRHLDRHGDGWQSERDDIAGPNGWPVYLARFEQLVA